VKSENAHSERRELAFKEVTDMAGTADRGKRQRPGKAAGQHPFGEIARIRVFRAHTAACNSAQILTNQEDGDEGNRTNPVSASKTPISCGRGTYSGTPDARKGAQTDPDLRFVIDHWYDLPDRVKAEVLRVVRDHFRAPDGETRRLGMQAALKQAHSDDRQGDRTYPTGDKPDMMAESE